jgi:hypothetical protein
MDNSPLATLPQELLDEIFRMALQNKQPHVFDGSSSIDAARVAQYNGLTRTCKAIRAQTLLLFWHANWFRVTGEHIDHAYKFWRTMGAEGIGVSQVRLFGQVRGDDWDTEWLDVVGTKASSKWAGFAGDVARYQGLGLRDRVQRATFSALQGLGMEIRYEAQLGPAQELVVWVVSKRE